MVGLTPHKKYATANKQDAALLKRYRAEGSKKIHHYVHLFFSLKKQSTYNHFFTSLRLMYISQIYRLYAIKRNSDLFKTLTGKNGYRKWIKY